MLPDILKPTTAKSAILLGQKMLETLPPPQADRSFLFVRGDKSSNDLQPMLRKAGYSVTETQVYITSANPRLEAYISEAIGTLPPSNSCENISPLWLVFFSPSTSEYALPHLEPLMRSERRVKVAAIGEKTRSFLAENGVKVDAVAEEPNAAGLVQALLGMT
jgi:uroporphyrinogen-III synthase